MGAGRLEVEGGAVDAAGVDHGEGAAVLARHLAPRDHLREAVFQLGRIVDVDAHERRAEGNRVLASGDRRACPSRRAPASPSPTSRSSGSRGSTCRRGPAPGSPACAASRPRSRPVTPIFSRGAAARGRAGHQATGDGEGHAPAERPASSAGRESWSDALHGRRPPREYAARPRRASRQHSILAYCASVNALYASAPTLASGPGEVKERRRATLVTRQRMPATGGTGATNGAGELPGAAQWIYQGVALAIAARRDGLAGWLRAAPTSHRGLTPPGTTTAARRIRCSTRRSTQINRGNVAHAPAGLVLSRWTTTPSASRSIPLIVDDVMYVRGAKGRLVALDAATGKEIWRSTEEAFDRGVSYWESPDRTDRRLMVTSQQRPARRSTRAPDS